MTYGDDMRWYAAQTEPGHEDKAAVNLRRRGGCVRPEPQRHLKNGDEVRVTEGAFASFLGLYEGLTENERALVLGDFLGRKVRALVDPEALAAA